MLAWGMLICVGGLIFGLAIYRHLKRLPVHKSMLEVSELIYETCKTYLKTQGKFILILWCFIAAIMVVYFGFLQTPPDLATINAEHLQQFSQPVRVVVILLFSLIGIAGSYFVACVRHPHQHLRQLAHRAGVACAARPIPVYVDSAAWRA